VYYIMVVTPSPAPALAALQLKAKTFDVLFDVFMCAFFRHSVGLYGKNLPVHIYEL